MNSAALLSCTITELALSADNVMVWAVIMRNMGVQPAHQRRVLAGGIAIAVVLRIAAIAAGAAALERVAWLTYVLGVVLVLTGYRIARSIHGDDDVDGNAGGRFVRTLGRFIKSRNVIAVIALGMTDVVFAVDSVPASFGVTSDPRVIAIANGIALAALWSMFRIVSTLMDHLPLLQHGLALVMVWLGVTMLGHNVIHVPDMVNMLVIASILGAVAGLSKRGTTKAALAAR